jgi:hypothetical protein
LSSGSRRPRKARNGAQNHLRGRRGTPRESFGDSIEGAEDSAPSTGYQALCEPGSVEGGVCFPPEQDAASIGGLAVMQAS